MQAVTNKDSPTALRFDAASSGYGAGLLRSLAVGDLDDGQRLPQLHRVSLEVRPAVSGMIERSKARAHELMLMRPLYMVVLQNIF